VTTTKLGTKLNIYNFNSRDLAAMNLLDFPNEIWIRILSNLDQKDLLNVSLVSKKVKELALDPVLWTNLNLRHMDDGPGLDIYAGRNSPIFAKHFAFDLNATEVP
jgi:hypothetical protein